MKRKILPAVLYGISAAAILSAAAVQTVAMLHSFEKGTNYFAVGATFPTVAVLLAVLGAVVGIVAVCLCGKASPAISPFSKRVYSALPSSLLFFACAILLPVFARGTDAALALRVPVAISCVLAGLYTCLSAIPSFRTAHATATALLGFSAPIACGLINAYYYFDMSVEMNSPLKYCTQVALLLAMLYFLGEIRFHINEPKPRLFVALALCTLAATALCAVAFPVAYFAGRIERFDYVLGSFLALGICITSLFRIIPYLLPLFRASAEEPRPNETAKEDDLSV